MRVNVGDSFSKTAHFDMDAIVRFANECGDTNPLHHDPAYAATTRFKGIIACGPHVTSLLMAMVADYLAKIGPNVGLEFSFRFETATRLDETLDLKWTVVAVTPKASLKGDIIAVEGAAYHADGRVATSGIGSAVLFDAP